MKISKKKCLGGILSLLIVLAIGTGSMLFFTKPSSAQQQPQVCESREYNCERTGVGENCFLTRARTIATADCQRKLDSCIEEKLQECAQFCLRQGCIISASQLPAQGVCQEPECKTKVRNTGFEINFFGICSISIGGSEEVHVCESAGKKGFKCKCIARETE